jgi:Tfp pilus assembly protein PilE
MRPFLFCLPLIVAAVALPSYAGSLEKCQQKEKDATGLRTCIEAERNHAANLLREADVAAANAIEDTHDRRKMNQYRMQQAHHVRAREHACGKQPSRNERLACEADMDYAQLEQVKRYTPE